MCDDTKSADYRTEVDPSPRKEWRVIEWDPNDVKMRCAATLDYANDLQVGDEIMAIWSDRDKDHHLTDGWATLARVTEIKISYQHAIGGVEDNVRLIRAEPII